MVRKLVLMFCLAGFSAHSLAQVQNPPTMPGYPTGTSDDAMYQHFWGQLADGNQLVQGHADWFNGYYMPQPLPIYVHGFLDWLMGDYNGTQDSRWDLHLDQCEVTRGMQERIDEEQRRFDFFTEWLSEYSSAWVAQANRVDLYDDLINDPSKANDPNWINDWLDAAIAIENALNQCKLEHQDFKLDTISHPVWISLFPNELIWFSLSYPATEFTP